LFIVIDCETNTLKKLKKIIFMCKIKEFDEQRLKDAVKLLSNESVRGYDLLTDGEEIYFSTSSGKRYRVNEKIIIVNLDDKSDTNTKMIPHKEMSRIFKELNIPDLVGELKNLLENVAFITKNLVYA